MFWDGSSFFFSSRGFIGVVPWYHDAMLFSRVIIIPSSQSNPSFLSLFTHAVSCGLPNSRTFVLPGLVLSNINAICTTFSGRWYSFFSLFSKAWIFSSFVLLELVILLYGSFFPSPCGTFSPPPWKFSSPHITLMVLLKPSSMSTAMYQWSWSSDTRSLIVLPVTPSCSAKYSLVARQYHFSEHKLLMRQNSNFDLSDNVLSNRMLFGMIPYHPCITCFAILLLC